MSQEKMMREEVEGNWRGNEGQVMGVDNPNALQPVCEREDSKRELQMA